MFALHHYIINEVLVCPFCATEFRIWKLLKTRQPQNGGFEPTPESLMSNKSAGSQIHSTRFDIRDIDIFRGFDFAIELLVKASSFACHLRNSIISFPQRFLHSNPSSSENPFDVSLYARLVGC